MYKKIKKLKNYSLIHFSETFSESSLSLLYVNFLLKLIKSLKSHFIFNRSFLTRWKEIPNIFAYLAPCFNLCLWVWYWDSSCFEMQPESYFEFKHHLNFMICLVELRKALSFEFCQLVSKDFVKFLVEVRYFICY